MILVISYQILNVFCVVHKIGKGKSKELIDEVIVGCTNVITNINNYKSKIILYFCFYFRSS